MGSGDWIYCAGTVLQLLAFALGMRPATLGIAIAVYGVGLALVARRWS